jgi:hypothetical protein
MDPIVGVLYGSIYAFSRAIISLILAGKRNTKAFCNKKFQSPSHYHPLINGIALLVILMYIVLPY